MLTTKFLQLRPTIMPVSSDCNLRCGYCYCHRVSNQIRHKMTEDVLTVVMDKFIGEYPEYISFCWHGGEPLLVGKSFFKKACDIQKRFQKENQEIENRLQTNATLIDKEWCHLFKENNFKIGISIDGPGVLNDKNRLFIFGKGTFGSIMKGIEILKTDGVEFSVLVTITSESVKYPEEIYRFIIDQKFHSIKLNPCFGPNTFRVDFVEYANFMNRIFDFWFADDRDDISFGHLGDIVNGFLGGAPRICHMRNSCYRHVKIDYNGDVLPCDSFLGADFKFGNIITQEINDIVNAKNYRDFFDESRRVLKECSICKWRELCGGGCSRYSFEGRMKKVSNKMCEAKKIMFNHISQTLDEAMKN